MRIRTANDLGLVIRERRHQLGLDQRTLAEKVGVSRQWLVEIEKGKSRAEVGLLLRTLNTLDLQLTTGNGKAITPEPDASITDIDIDALIDKARGDLE